MRSLFVILLFLPALALAQPAITDISGSPNTVTHGSAVTISGSSFGTKPNAAPLKWDTFEAGASGSLLASVQPEWVPIYNNDLGGTLYTNSRSHSGSLSVYNAVNRPDRRAANDGEWEANWFRTPLSNTIFISYWIRVESSDMNGVHKMCRITSSTDAGGEGVYNGYGSFAFGGNLPCEQPQMDVSTDNNTGLNLGNTYITTPGCGTWFQVQMGRTLNSIGSSNGWLGAGIVGYEMLNFENNANVFVSGPFDGKSLQLDTVLLGTMVANYVDGDDTAVYIDDIYIDNTRARVELGNNAVYANCSHREMQIPSSWNNTGISVTANTGTFPEGPAWLFVVNAAGQASPGFPVTVQAGAAVLGPGAPGQPQITR